MCLAIPGKIKSVDRKSNTAVVDFDGIKREVNVSLVDVKKRDYVIVHAGFAIEKLTSKDAREISNLLEGK